MMRVKSDNILVVAPASSSIPFPAQKHTFHFSNVSGIFPAIHVLQPGSIILDYDYTANNIEKILRRLTANPFYSKLKIYCYKPRPQIKEDELLQALGVHYFIYAETQKLTKQRATVKALDEMLEDAVVKSLADPSYSE